MDKQIEEMEKDMTDVEFEKTLRTAVIAKELNDFFDKTPIELTYTHPNGEEEVLPDDFYQVINDITKQAIIPFVAEVLVGLGYRKIDENAVVLTEEELFARDENIHKADREYIKALEECINNRNTKTRKETAEKFAKKAKEKLIEWLVDNEDLNGKIDFGVANIDLIGVIAKDGEVISLGLIDEICKEITEGKNGETLHRD